MLCILLLHSILRWKLLSGLVSYNLILINKVSHFDMVCYSFALYDCQSQGKKSRLNEGKEMWCSATRGHYQPNLNWQNNEVMVGLEECISHIESSCVVIKDIWTLDWSLERLVLFVIKRKKKRRNHQPDGNLHWSAPPADSGSYLSLPILWRL